MKDIKTKDSAKKDIKVLDKAGNLAKAVRKTAVRSKDQIENLADDGQITPSEYAEDKVKYMAENAVEDSGRLAGKGVKKTYESGKKHYKDMRRKRQERKAGEEPIKQTAKSTGKQTAKQVERSVKTQQKNIKTAEKTARQTVKTSKDTAKAAVKTAEQTAKASKKAAEAAAKTAQKAAQVAKEAAVKAYQGTVVAVKATIAAIKAISAGIAKLVAAIAAGGSVATLIIVVICFIGLIVGSCFGIFFSNESGTEGRPLSQVVSELNTEFQSSITDIQSRTTYDDFEITSNDGVTAINWEDVLSVFSVKTTTGDNAQNVACLTDDKVAILRDIMWDMNSISQASKTETKTVSVRKDDGTTETRSVTRTVLTVTITHKSYLDMIGAYSFNSQQQEQLKLLKDDEYATLWGELLGGYSHGTGEIRNGNSSRTPKDIFSWPLEEQGTVTSYFGYREDPITGKTDYHNGIDIAMPNGTPILAAADGNVIIANSTDSYGGSYGYYVKLGHKDTFETLYAHCSKICVVSGQQVKKGQIIGYVGSTGRSTGNHLHFEVWKNGKRTNALAYFN